MVVPLLLLPLLLLLLPLLPTMFALIVCKFDIIVFMKFERFLTFTFVFNIAAVMAVVM